MEIEPAQIKLARRILSAIRRKGWAGFSSRDAQREVDGNGGVKAEDVAAALQVLLRADIIRSMPAPVYKSKVGGRKPSPRWSVNSQNLNNNNNNIT